MRPPHGTLRLGAVIAWAILVLVLYYRQLWRELPLVPELAASGEVGIALKLAGLAAAAAVAVTATALPLGIGLERLLGWSQLSPRATFLRRCAFGSVVLFAVLGPFHGPLGGAAHAIAGLRLPFIDEAVSRSLAGIFGLIVVSAAALPVGQFVCELLRWRPRDWRDELLYSASVGYGVVAAACGGLAVAGLYRPRAIQALLALFIAAGLPRLLRLARRAGHWPVTESRGQGWFVRALQVVSALAMLMAFLSALAPETEYDALWYHLGLPSAWLEAGRPVDLVHEFVSLYPLTWELVYAAGLVTGGPVSARLLHFTCFGLGGVLVWQLSTRLAPKAQPWLAVALFLTAPTVLWEASTTYVDLALALYLGLGTLALLHYVDGRDRGWFAMAVVTLGLALAIKHLGLVVLAILAAGLAAWLWRQEGWSVRQALRPALLLVALAVIVPLPWYLRSWLASGNPVFPELYGVFGASPPWRWDDLAQDGLNQFKARFGVARTPLNLLTLPWDVTMHGFRYHGSFGPLFLVLLPALAVFGRSGTRLRWMGWFVVLFVAVWASPVSSFQLRFLVPLVPMLAVLGAEAAHRLTAASRPPLSAAIAAVLVVLLAFNLPPFTRFHERDRVGWNGWISHVIHTVPLPVVVGRESEEDYISRRVPTYGAWQFINREASPDARVLTFRGGDHFYSGRRRISSVSPAARPAVWLARDGDEVLQELRALGVTHMVVDRPSLANPPPALALLGERRGQHIDLLFEDRGALVFGLREP